MELKGSERVSSSIVGLLENINGYEGNTSFEDEDDDEDDEQYN